MAKAFSAESEERIERLLRLYPTKQAALLPTLWLAQREFGWLSDEVMEMVAGRLQLQPSQVISTATFYTMFDKKPVGKHHVQMCTNVSCMLRGSDELVEVACKKLGVQLGETTADGNVTLSEVQCLGSCGSGPMCQVNEDYHENLTRESLEQLLDRLQGEDAGEEGAPTATEKEEVE